MILAIVFVLAMLAAIYATQDLFTMIVDSLRIWWHGRR